MEIKKIVIYALYLCVSVFGFIGTMRCMKKTTPFDGTLLTNKQSQNKEISYTKPIEKNYDSRNGNKIKIEHLQDVNKMNKCLQEFRNSQERGPAKDLGVIMKK